MDVISKGTIADNDLLNDKDSSYIASILFFSDSILMTVLDISTGYLATITLENSEEILVNEILELNLKEVIFIDNLNTSLISLLKNTYNIQTISLNSLATLSASDRKDKKDYISIMMDNINSIKLEVNK